MSLFSFVREDLLTLMLVFKQVCIGRVVLKGSLLQNRKEPHGTKY